ncbi:MAG: hypothetical protein V8R01_06695 [Bacilli bacterium]
MLDNGKGGHRDEMLGIMRDYLNSMYSTWEEEQLIYRKCKRG